MTIFDRFLLWLAGRIVDRYVIRTPDPNHPGYFFYKGPHRAVRAAIDADAMARGEVVR